MPLVPEEQKKLKLKVTRYFMTEFLHQFFTSFNLKWFGTWRGSAFIPLPLPKSYEMLPDAINSDNIGECV
jgi:hypothetical protein